MDTPRLPAAPIPPHRGVQSMSVVAEVVVEVADTQAAEVEAEAEAAATPVVAEDRRTTRILRHPIPHPPPF